MKNTQKTFQTDKVITVSFGHMAHDIYSSFLGPMLPMLIEKLGFSLSLAGLLDVIRRTPSLITPLIGLIADRVSLKILVILTPAITSLAMCLLGIAPSYLVVAILLFVAGISSSLFHVPSPVIISNLSGNKTATGMGFYMFGGELARTLGPLIITGALSRWGLEGSLRLIPFGIVASLILYIKLKDVKRNQITKKIQTSTKASKTIKNLRPLFTSISVFLFFRAGLKSSLTIFLPTYLIAKGESLWFAGSALSILQLAGALGTVSTGYISNRIDRKTILLISSVCSPIFMLSFIYCKPLMIPSLILLGFSLFAPGPVLLTMVQETKTSRPAFVNSVYMTITFIISSVTVLAAGYAGDLFGLETTYKFFTFFSILSIPSTFLLQKKQLKQSIKKGTTNESQ